MSSYGCDTCQFEIFLFKKCSATWQVTCAMCQANIDCFQFSPSIYNFDLI